MPSTSTGRAGRTRRPTKPTVLLLGDRKQRAELQEKLAALPLHLRVDESPATRNQVAKIDGSQAAAIVLAPRRLSGTTALIRQLRDRHAQTLLLVAAARGTADASVAAAYRAGAAEVFDWPDEVSALVNTLRELLGVALPKVRPSAADRALLREIRARLRAMGDAAPRTTKVRVHAGVASLAGEADRLWKKHRADLELSQIPGIRSIDLRHVEVASSGLRDDEIARALRALLRRASSIEDRTLAVSVHEGHVVVCGTVSCWEEWEHARDLIAFSKGVRSVTDRTVNSTQRKRSDRNVARRLQATLQVLLSGSAEVRAAVLGRTAVLRGTTRHLATKRQAASLARRDPAIERVVNRIEVTS